MSYYDICSKYKEVSSKSLFSGISDVDVKNALASDGINTKQYAALLAPAAEQHLEEMARKAHEITLRHFGRTIQLYTPMYLSNYCDNQCLYCGFNSNNDIERRRLDIEEVEREAAFISSTGLRHILILTGESRDKSSVAYIKECVKAVKKHFSSIAIEVYPLTEAEYAELISEGVDALTIYQEAYDEDLYGKIHPAGPKRDYRFRLDAPERGAKSGMRNVSIGALLGLGDWRKEVFLLGLHARYLEDKFPQTEVGVSIPRIRPQVSAFKPPFEVSDKQIAGIITALRIFLPRAGISISTRESPALRERLIPLGITRMSAGSTTVVGGHTVKSPSEVKHPQFEILDKRSVDEVMGMLEAKGYQPVLKDWMQL